MLKLVLLVAFFAVLCTCQQGQNISVAFSISMYGNNDCSGIPYQVVFNPLESGAPCKPVSCNGFGGSSHSFTCLTSFPPFNDPNWIYFVYYGSDSFCEFQLGNVRAFPADGQCRPVNSLDQNNRFYYARCEEDGPVYYYCKDSDCQHCVSENSYKSECTGNVEGYSRQGLCPGRREN